MLELVQGADKQAFFCLEFYANSFCLDWTLISGNLGEIGFEKSLFGRPGLRNLSWQPGILLDEVKGGLEVIVWYREGEAHIPGTVLVLNFTPCFSDYLT